MKFVLPRYSLVSLILFISGIVLAFIRLSVPLFDSPFLFPDSFDWLANGLQYSGILPSVEPISHRGMFLTLILSAFYRFNLIYYASIIGTLFHMLLALALIPIVSRVFSPATALWTSLFCFFSFTLLGQSAFLGADVIANFFLSVFSLLYLRFLLAPSGKSLYALAILFGLGVHTQYIFPILAPTFFVFFVLMLFSGKRKDVLMTIFSRDGIFSLILCVSIIALLFSPRILLYNVIYEEKVQHASLLSFSIKGVPYFISAYLVGFSWWIVLLTLVGALSSLFKRGPSTMPVLFLLSWICNIFVFFGMFYSWQDCRFWIYAATPTFILSALGTQYILSRFRRSAYKWLFLIGTFYFIHSPATLDPWDNDATVTPTLAFVFNGGLSGEFQRYNTIPYFWGHYQELATTKLHSQQSGFSHNMRDTEAREALQKAAELVPSGETIGYYAVLDPGEFYIVSNRNKAYARANIETLRSHSEIAQFLAKGRFLICQLHDLAAIEETIRTRTVIKSTALLSKRSKSFRLLELDPTLLPDEPQAHQRVESLYSLDGGSKLENLFDGITHSSENFATIPLNIPLKITFPEAREVQSLTLHFWSFDQRVYEVSAGLIDDHGGRHLLSDFKGEQSGVRQSKFQSDNIKSIEIIGTRNSSTEWIPGNDFLHLTEVEID